MGLAQQLYILLQFAHVVGVVLWAGSMLYVVWLLLLRRDGEAIALLRVTGWPATLGVLLAGATGIGMGVMRGFDPLVWVKVALYVSLLVIGGAGHAIVVRERGNLKKGVISMRIKMLLLASALVTLMLIAVGTGLRFGLALLL